VEEATIVFVGEVSYVSGGGVEDTVAVVMEKEIVMEVKVILISNVD